MPINIACATGQFITSGSLKYGRWDNSICPGPGVTNSTTASFQTFNLPSSCLQGVNLCGLGSAVNLNQGFGDPYPGVAKHVRIFYLFYTYKLIYIPFFTSGK